MSTPEQIPAFRFVGGPYDGLEIPAALAAETMALLVKTLPRRTPDVVLDGQKYHVFSAAIHHYRRESESSPLFIYQPETP